MKVLVMNRGADHPGGDLVHIAELTKALLPYGVYRHYWNWNKDEYSPVDFDLIHIQHINFDWCRPNFEAAVASGRPYIVTCCAYDSLFGDVTWEEIRGWLEGAEAVICYTAREEILLRAQTRFNGQITRIPPGVGQEFFFFGDTPSERVGVIAVEARAGAKNSSFVARACEAAGLPFQGLCGLSREDLAKAYAGARLFVMPTLWDTFGLTVLEALASYCRCLVSIYAGAAEWLPGLQTFVPGTASDLAQLITWAYNVDQWNWEPNIRARTLTWDREAREVFNVYQRVLTQHMFM